jgi:hypothetical protein
VLCLAIVATACGGQPQGSPGASGGAATPASPGASTLSGSGAPSLAPTADASTAPTGPVATPMPSETYRFGDILKIQVNRLAARKAPLRSSPLVRRYDTSGESPVDKGEVRLSKGNLVMVGLGPLRVGTIVWYLVWPSPAGKVSDGTSDWYSGNPADMAGGPAWVAASLDAEVYMTLERRPDAAEIEQATGIGLNAAGTGPFESVPQLRHDAFLLDWAAAAPEQGTACSIRISLVPADPAIPPMKPIDTSTSTVKVSALLGDIVTAPWLPAPEGSWKTFTVKIAGTCSWAFRLTRLEHD